MLSERKHLSTARISITVIDFQALGSKQGCSKAEIKLIDTGRGVVSQGRPNEPIVVHHKVYLDFDVHAGHGDSYSYSPVGMGFKETIDGEARETGSRSRTPSDLLGHAAFPLRTAVSKGDTMQLTLLDANPEPGEFDFSLIIQRSDGLLSVVDPKIRNWPQ